MIRTDCSVILGLVDSSKGRQGKMVANSKKIQKTSQFCGAHPNTRNEVGAVHRSQAGI